MAKGYLRKINYHKRLYLDKKDVLAFKRALHDPIKGPDAIILTKLQGQVREQQNDIDTIKRILDLYNEPLELEDFSIHALYKAASALDIPSWEEGWEKEWGELLIRFREEDLFQLEKITSDEHPWKPFYKLIMVIQELMLKQNKQEYIELYNSAREHFRKLILIWIEIKNSPKALDQLPKSEFGKAVLLQLRNKFSGKKELK